MRELSQHKDYSESTAILIDREVKRIITECYEKARSIILEHRDELERIAAALLEREVLEGSEISALMRGETLPPMVRPAPQAPPEKHAAKGAEEKPRRSPKEAAGPSLPEPAKS